MTAVATHAAAPEKARAWLEAATDSMDVRVQQLPNGKWRAVIHAPHPFADDVMVRVPHTADDRATALSGARSALWALGLRTFDDPEQGRHDANRAREAHLYVPSAKGLRRVMAAVDARGEPPTSRNEIRLAAFNLKIDRGHQDHLIGDIVDELLAGRSRLARSRPLSMDQRALL